MKPIGWAKLPCALRTDGARASSWRRTPVGRGGHLVTHVLRAPRVGFVIIGAPE